MHDSCRVYRHSRRNSAFQKTNGHRFSAAKVLDWRAKLMHVMRVQSIYWLSFFHGSRSDPLALRHSLRRMLHGWGCKLRDVIQFILLVEAAKYSVQP